MSTTPSAVPAPLPTGPWDGRAAFADLVRSAFERAAIEGWPLIILSDPDFADWPLGERRVVDALQAWASRGRQLHLLARDFRPLREQAPRLVQWRVTWDHVVQARSCQGALGDALPSALWSPVWTLERLDSVHSRGVSTAEAKRRVELRERLDSKWERASPAFPASTLGL